MPVPYLACIFFKFLDIVTGHCACKINFVTPHSKIYFTHSGVMLLLQLKNKSQIRVYYDYL